MSKFNIGTLRDSAPGARDAVHVPVICLTSYVDLTRGQRVCIDRSGRECLPESKKGEYDGIVDPFLEEPTIKAGTPFYVFVKPSLVASFRHSFEIEGVLDEDQYEDGDWNCQGCY